MELSEYSRFLAKRKPVAEEMLKSNLPIILHPEINSRGYLNHLESSWKSFDIASNALLIDLQHG